jgi:DNA modification methylase
MSSIIGCPSGSTAKDFGHPFSKPKDVWKWIYNAVCIKGQTVFDPFAGAGSSCVAAIEFGLDSIGCEVQSQHYNTLILNLQKTYKQLVGEHVIFQ